MNGIIMLLLVIIGFIVPEKLDQIGKKHGDFIAGCAALVALIWIIVAICGYCEPIKGTAWYWLKNCLQ